MQASKMFVHDILIPIQSKLDHGKKFFFDDIVQMVLRKKKLYMFVSSLGWVHFSLINCKNTIGKPLLTSAYLCVNVKLMGGHMLLSE
jgi:hypothetical protein